MSRATDAAFPTVTVDTHPPPRWMSGRLVVALERLPQSADVWDDLDAGVVWEDIDPAIVLVTDPCDNFTAAPWTVAGTPTVVAAGFTGNGFSLPTGGTSSLSFDIPAAKQTDTVTVGFRIRSTNYSPSGTTMVQFRSDAGATLHCEFRIDEGFMSVFRTGGAVLGTTFNSGPNENVWRLIEIRLKLSDTVGQLVLRVDGVDRVTIANQDTKNGGTKTVWDQIRLVNFHSGIYGPVVFDDVYVRNDANWGGTGIPTDIFWDETTPLGYSDVWCDTSNLAIIHGEPDAADMFAMSACQLELVDPGDGRYRTRTPDGRLVYYAPGRRLAIWWQAPDNSRWWLFSGQLATWRERLDNTVAIEAYAGNNLGRQPGVDWTAGIDGQVMSQRVPAILAAPAVDYTTAWRSDVGDVTLAVPEAADTAGIDALRQVAWSDGGIVFTDADDTLIVRNRDWRDGRSDQTTITTLTDNVCDIDALVVWEPLAADDDVLLAGTVRLTNTAATPLVAVAYAFDVDPSIVYTHPGPDLWKTQTVGDTLAAHIAAQRGVSRLALGQAALYLHDPRFDYWAAACDLRIGDAVRFVHQDTFTTSVAIYDIGAVVTTVRHLVTPDTWIVELGTRPTTDFTAVENWDQTNYLYDDALALWR